MAKISYLIATKNRANTIGETLKSLQTQTFGDWEAIVIDDHSSDDTKSLILKLSDNRIKYLALPDRLTGAASARNFGILWASSPIIAILDSDDIAYPDRTAITLEHFKVDPSTDIFYGNIDVFEEKTGILRDRKTPFTAFSYQRLIEGNFITHSTVAIKRHLLLDFPYNPIFKIAEDYELYTRLMEYKAKFSYTEQKIVKYRIHGDNLSVGQSKVEITQLYTELARMMRGWIPYNSIIIQKIDELEKGSAQA